jgi:hypothetical protein
MADIRTLKLALLADTKDFIAGLDKADKETRSFSNKLDDALKVGAAAFLAVGAAAATMAIKIGTDAVKAAIEDQKAQVLLAQALRNTTEATDQQIAGVESYIEATARATGVNDGQLRPSFERLLRSTESVTKAQQLQTLALDISRGTGKDLLSVSDALGRAYEGQFKGLKDLGIELKTSITTTNKAKVSKEGLAKAETSAEGATLRVAAAQEKLNKVLNNAKSDALDIARAQNAFEAAQQRAADATGKYEAQQNKLGKTITSTKEVAVSFDNIVGQLTDKFQGQAAAYALTFAGRMDIVTNSFDEAKEKLGFALLPFMERFLILVQELTPVIEGFVSGLTGEGKKSMSRAFYDVGTGAVTFGYDLNNAKGAAYLLGEEIRLVAIKVGDFVAQLTGAANDKGLQGFLDKILSIIDAIESAISAYNRLPDIGKLLVNPASQLATLTPAVKQATGSVVNIYNNVKGAIDPQSTARAITKVQNTAAQTTGLKPFFYGFR